MLVALALGLSACSSGASVPTSLSDTGSSSVRMGAWSPSQLDLIAATGDPAVMPSTPGFSPGVLYVNRVYVDQNRAAHAAQLAVITAGEGISNAFIGVYDPSDDKLLATTADLSQSLQKPGIIRADLTTEIPAQPMNKKLWIVLLIGGMTKPPTVIGGREYGSNLGLTGDYRLWVSDANNLTSFPVTMPKLKVPEHGSIPFVAIAG